MFAVRITYLCIKDVSVTAVLFRSVVQESRRRKSPPPIAFCRYCMCMLHNFSSKLRLMLPCCFVLSEPPLPCAISLLIVPFLSTFS